MSEASRIVKFIPNPPAVTRLPVWRVEMAMAEAKRKLDYMEMQHRAAEREYWRLRDEVEQARKDMGGYRI